MGLAKRLPWFSIAFAICCTVPQLMAAAHQPKIDLRQNPTGNTRSVVTSLGLYITDIVGIDESRENFELGGYLTATWHDPRLKAEVNVGHSPTGTNKRTFRMGEIWTPPIEIVNSVSYKIKSHLIEADENGDVTLIQRFHGIFTNTYALKKFPFDTQVLEIEFEPFLSAVPQIRFARQPLSETGFRSGSHAEVAGWRLKNVQYEAASSASDGSPMSSSEALFRITMHRQPGFYIWKIFLPIAIMSLIPMIVFWIDPKEFDWLLKVPMWMLLSMVAFEFAIVRDLPKVGYITFLDAVITTSFAFFFLVIAEITAVYLVQKGRYRPQMVKIHAAGRWVYPAAYFIAILSLYVGFFGGK